MNALGWDQQELVEQTGLPRTTVANLLHGQNLMPKIPTVGALADALEVPPHEIMEACGVPLMAAPKDETRSEQAQRFGRVIDSIEPLRELYDILQGANLSQIEDVVTYARNVVRNKN